MDSGKIKAFSQNFRENAFFRACSHKPKCSDCEADFSHNEAIFRKRFAERFPVRDNAGINARTLMYFLGAASAKKN